MKVLDAFCGLKGASRAMRDRGWTVYTMDIDPRFEPDFVADARTWQPPAELHGLDLAWFSPPCDEFARESMPWSRTGAEPDMSLVTATQRLIAELQPRFWAIENVRGAIRHFEPIFGTYAAHSGPFFIWTNFPLTLPRTRHFKERLSSTQKAERAEVPYAISEAVALTVESTVPLLAA